MRLTIAEETGLLHFMDEFVALGFSFLDCR